MKNKIKKYFGYAVKSNRPSLNEKFNRLSILNKAIKKFLLWNIDTAMRYYPVIKYIESTGKNNLKILDAGSGSLGLSLYYPRRSVNLDINFSGPKLPHSFKVSGSILNIPFRKGAFDLVACIDTLEHLPSNQRKKALQEIINASRDGVIISFPCGRSAEKSDLQYNQIIKNRTGKDHPFLLEHFKYQLPDDEMIKNELKAILDKDGLKYTIKKHGNYGIGLLSFFRKHMHEGNIMFYFITNKILFFLFPFLRLIRSQRFYRTVLIIERTRES